MHNNQRNKSVKRAVDEERLRKVRYEENERQRNTKVQRRKEIGLYMEWKAGRERNKHVKARNNHMYDEPPPPPLKIVTVIMNTSSTHNN